MPKKSRSTKGRRRMNRRKSTKNMLKMMKGVRGEKCDKNNGGPHKLSKPYDDIHRGYGWDGKKPQVVKCTLCNCVKSV